MLAPRSRPTSTWWLALTGVVALAWPLDIPPAFAAPSAETAAAAKKPAKSAKAPAKPHSGKAHSSKSHSSKKPAAEAKAPDKASDKPSNKASETKKPDGKASAANARAGKARKSDKPGKQGKPGKETPAAAKLAPPLALTPAAIGALPAAAPARVEKAAATNPPLAYATGPAPSSIDVAAVKRAIDLVRARKQSEAGDVRNTVTDPTARKLIEWVILRSDDAGASFSRYTAFITENPSWPSIVTLRRKAEAVLYQEPADAAAVRAFFSRFAPLSAKGRFAYARALVALGDRKQAEAQVREMWRKDSFTADMEARIRTTFGEFITAADDKARMDRRLYVADDVDAGMRAAARLGGYQPAIAKARIAVLTKASNAKALLDAVPAAARSDPGYLYSHAQWLRRGDHTAEAAAQMLKMPAEVDSSHDLDELWIERRLLVRKLLDENEFKTAYLVARGATPPNKDFYQADQQFTAGWIALRYLHDPATAAAHFKHIAGDNENPIVLGRAAYWQGRAAEAMKNPAEARSHFQEAARYSTAYYGQIARAKLGLGEIGISASPSLSSAQRAKLSQLEVVRAAELLYAADARDLVNVLMADLGDKCDEPGALIVLGEVAAKNKDARGMLLVGKLALGHGHPLEHAAFPTFGVPAYTAIGPEAEQAIVYSITRQESWFNPRTVSSASAFGLMQVTPAAGKYIAKKFKVGYDQSRLLNDQVYNVQMGAAELGDLIKDYRGSYIMAFAAYNAGRGRVRQWVERYGDPRDPKVDPIDWVERIPFSETRNYVQRVMENVQVYRARFGGNSRLLIEADLRRGAPAN